MSGKCWVFSRTRTSGNPSFPPLYYDTSVNRLNLLLIEQRLRKLTSPQWPRALAPIDDRQAAAGRVHYQRYCATCHAIAVDRREAIRSLKVTLTPLQEIGTDPLMTTNASTREAQSGILEGVRMPAVIGMPLKARDSGLAVTANIVIGSILAPLDGIGERSVSLGFRQ